ncbi:MAG: hypothetical protein M3Y12_00550 [Bacteroidota bacterium]|nr:hypothetical protein [Bacteroidota bacterium]
MKNHFSAVSKLVAAAICALSLGSCSRAEYAMLPQGASYHGVARVATPVPAATVAPAAVVTEAAAPAVVAVAPATPVQAPSAVGVAPAAQEVAVVPAAKAAKSTVPAAMATTTAAAPKLSLVQRVALNKVTRKMDKLMQKSGSVRQHDNTASTAKTQKVSGNLRTGLILLLVGLLVGIFNTLIGTIIALIGVIFIVLWLLDSL